LNDTEKRPTRRRASLKTRACAATSAQPRTQRRRVHAEPASSIRIRMRVSGPRVVQAKRHNTKFLYIGASGAARETTLNPSSYQKRWRISWVVRSAETWMTGFDAQASGNRGRRSEKAYTRRRGKPRRELCASRPIIGAGRNRRDRRPKIDIRTGLTRSTEFRVQRRRAVGDDLG
jgi:hypothetical protein